MVLPVKLKICGVTQIADLEICAHLGVDAIGLNLWSGSRRALSRREAHQLYTAWPKTNLQRIGVFVDPNPNELQTIAQELSLDAVQLHGNRPVTDYATLGIPYVWVIRGTPDVHSLILPNPLPQWILLDAEVTGYGGMGKTTDWSWAQQASAHWLQQMNKPVPIWLAGGITPENAAEAIAMVQPAGLDVASGSEDPTNPRKKDPAKVQTLVKICKNTR